jgi:hypothetical protein
MPGWFVFRTFAIHDWFEMPQFDQSSNRHGFKMEQDSRALVIDAGGQTVQV